jgi:F-type H+-transporting ATPase subunit gamma
MARGLPVLRRRITSVKATKKVTKAMEMIATTKLKVFKQALFDSRLYAQQLFSIVNGQLRHEDIQLLPYFHLDASLPTLHIVISSQLGLCGSYNAVITQASLLHIKPKDEVIPIGVKGLRVFKKSSCVLIEDYVEVSLQDTLSLRPLIDQIIKAFKDKQYGKVLLHFNRFVNSLTFTPTMQTLLPLSLPTQDVKGYPPLVEPDATTVFERLLPLYLKNTLYAGLIEAQVSEQSSRRNAMEKASDNADDLVDQLQLEFNKQRQANITQEIAEIIGGSSQ